MKLIVAWQSPKSREWIPIGQLSFNVEKSRYEFFYTQGINKAQENGFSHFPAMKKLDLTYCSDILFPLFSNRILAKTRPEYKLYQEWLGLDEASTPLDELAKNNGFRVTDTIELYLIPENMEGNYCIEFFSHGISHLSPQYQDRVKKLENEEKLFLVKDLQNPYDSNALLIRTKDPVELVGYAPRMYAKDMNMLLDRDKEATLKVKRVNLDAPMQFQLLCEFRAKWFESFQPFGTQEFLKY